MTIFRRLALYSATIATAALCGTVAYLQNPPPRPDPSIQGTAEAFKGVTTDGKVREGLYKIKASGVSTAGVRKAADAFIAGLNPEQQKKTMFPVGDVEWRKWDNRHFPPRQGTSFLEMTEQQRKLAFDLIGAGLSVKGLEKTKNIMLLNGTLAELTNNFKEYGEWLYWITIMGKPSATEPWGWQLDGHHVIINYFILGDQVVMTPGFMGSEPIRAESGKFKGTVVLQDEQNKGLALMQALTVEQQRKAIIATEKGRSNNLSEAYKDNLVLDYAGLRASELNPAQKKLFLDVVGEFVGNMDNGHAKVKMSEVEQYLGETWFAWIGSTAADGVFYYRIHSPVILIEFDHQGPIALGRSGPTRNHIHTVVRTPNGNDYGTDLLRLHYKQHPH